MSNVWFHRSCQGGYTPEQIDDLKAIEIIRLHLTAFYDLRANERPENWGSVSAMLLGAMEHLQRRVWGFIE